MTYSKTRTNTKETHTKISSEELLCDQVISFFEKGYQFKKDWKKTSTSGDIINFSTGKDYTNSNVILLLMAQALGNYQHSLWSGVFQASGKKTKKDKGNGLQIRKGEKGSRIMMPIFIKKKDKAGNYVLDQNGKPVLICTGFRPTCVFNIDQFLDCDKKESIIKKYTVTSAPGAEAEAKKIEHKESQKMIDKYLSTEKISFAHGGNSAYYSPTTDHIQMPPKEAFSSTCGYYGTLYHEALHSTGTKSRCQRESLLAPNSNRKMYALDEIIVEFGSVILCHEQKISTIDKLQNSSAYIEHWIEILKENKKTILQEILSQSVEAVNYLKNAGEKKDEK
tara:strand:- start:94 stop:1101 length:1008 start_codon:yes stop_codon:yes gene_type:complete